eukprot:gene4809-6550_t
MIDGRTVMEIDPNGRSSQEVIQLWTYISDRLEKNFRRTVFSAKGDYLALVTLGFGEIIRVIFQNVEFLGGALGLNGIPAYTSIFWVLAVVAISVFVVTCLAGSPETGKTIIGISPLFGLDDDDLFKMAWQRSGSLRDALTEHAATDSKLAAAQQRLAKCEQRFARETPFSFYAWLLGGDGGRARILRRLDGDVAQIFKHRQRRVDDAGAGAVGAADLVLDFLDDFVAVPRPLGHQRQNQQLQVAVSLKKKKHQRAWVNSRTLSATDRSAARKVANPPKG